jgi:hypothetical protein
VPRGGFYTHPSARSESHFHEFCKGYAPHVRMALGTDSPTVSCKRPPCTTVGESVPRDKNQNMKVGRAPIPYGNQSLGLFGRKEHLPYGKQGDGVLFGAEVKWLKVRISDEGLEEKEVGNERSTFPTRGRGVRRKSGTQIGRKEM